LPEHLDPLGFVFENLRFHLSRRRIIELRNWKAMLLRLADEALRYRIITLGRD
jgi:hypothetical protein